MRNAISALKKFQPATIISILALFIAIGGSATAASSLINGKNIKRGTISTKQLKNKSITKAKLKPATIKALKGKRGPEGSPGETGPAGEPGATGAAGPVGPKGATGAPGAKGATGAKGPAGIVKPEYVRSAGNTNLDSNGVMVPLITDNLPGGKYAVTAKVSVMAGGKGACSCRLVVDGQTVDEMVWDAGAVFDRGGVFLQTVTPSGTEKVRILCASLSASMQVSQKSIVSLPVS